MCRLWSQMIPEPEEAGRSGATWSQGDIVKVAMGFLSKLFDKGEEPERSCSDELLGPLEYFQDAESWLGSFNDHKFSLAYDRTKRPSEAVIVYAREILSDLPWLTTTLADAKKSAQEEYGEFYSSEIGLLEWGEIHFYLHKGKRRIIAELEGGRDDRLWRIEYADRHCVGIGFDR